MQAWLHRQWASFYSSIQSIYIFLFVLGTVSFWIPIYLNFLFDFFFNQTSMNARAKAMVVTQMQPVSTLLALITARVGQATKGMG